MSRGYLIIPLNFALDNIIRWQNYIDRPFGRAYVALLLNNSLIPVVKLIVMVNRRVLELASFHLARSVV